MATAKMEPIAIAAEPKIKMAMENIGLGERADDLLDMLDEIELDLMLKESEEDEKAGRFITTDELRKKWNMKE